MTAAKRFQHCRHAVETFPAEKIVYTLCRQLGRAQNWPRKASSRTLGRAAAPLLNCLCSAETFPVGAPQAQNKGPA